MLMIILMLMFLFGFIRFAVRLAWGLTKITLGLILFFGCPVLFVAAAVFGLLGHGWFWILLLGVVCGRMFAGN